MNFPKLFLFLFLFFIPFSSFAQIYITEVMYNPKGNDADREWIEAINLGEDIEVKTGKKGWRLFDGKNNRLLKENNFTWRRNEIILFVKNKDVFLREYKNLPNVKLVESSFSLNNKNGAIRIIDENKKTLAEFIYSSSIGGNGNGRSLVNENGIIKEGKTIGGTPGIYPEPSYTLEQKEGKRENIINKFGTSTDFKESKNTSNEEQSELLFLSSNTTTNNDKKENSEENQRYIIITEFFPNPEGKDLDEFIEIYNPENYTQLLDGIILAVGNKKIKLKGEIKPKEYIAFYKKELNFNIRNKGEEISLIDNDGREIFYIEYKGNAPKGLSFSRDDAGRWSWTIPTPNKPNVFIQSLKENNDENNENIQKSYLDGNITFTDPNKSLLANQLNSTNKSYSFYGLKVILLGIFISIISAILISLIIK